MFCPINAASIGIVPDPQNGSTNGRSGFQFVNLIKDAANVSFNGASLDPYGIHVYEVQHRSHQLLMLQYPLALQSRYGITDHLLQTKLYVYMLF